MSNSNKTYPEIMDQYNALGRTIDYVLGRADEVKSFFSAGFSRIIVIGSGSSYSVAKTAALTADLSLPYPAMAIPAGDLLLNESAYAPILKNALILSVSRSGSTDEIIEAIKKIKAGGYGVKAFSIVQKDGSRAEEVSDFTLVTPWAFDESVCQTRSVTNLAGAAQLVTAIASERTDIIGDLKYIAEHGGAYLARIEPLTKRVAAEKFRNVAVLADAEAFGLAEEGSLAFNEIAYMPSVCKHVLDMRHGPIVLVDDGTLALIHLNGNGTEHSRKLVLDVIGRGAGTIVYSAPTMDEPIDGVLGSIDFGKKLCAPVEVLPLLAAAQLIAYHSAMERGVNPDQPEGLDPWIAL